MDRYTRLISLLGRIEQSMAEMEAISEDTDDPEALALAAKLRDLLESARGNIEAKVKVENN